MQCVKLAFKPSYEINSDWQRKQRVYWFEAVLYPEDPTHEMFVKQLLPASDFDYAYVLHDQDVSDLGEVLKPHYQIAIHSGPFARTRSSVLKALNVPDRMQHCFYASCYGEKYLLYLTHRDEASLRNENKHIYDLTQIEGTEKLKNKAIVLSANNVEIRSHAEMMNEILAYFDSCSSAPTYLDFMHFLVDNALDKEARAWSGMWIKMVNDAKDIYARDKANEIAKQKQDDFIKHRDELLKSVADQSAAKKKKEA